jgi:hypothetical protein
MHALFIFCGLRSIPSHTQVPSYYTYVSLYALLTTAKLRSLATALGANPHAAGMRRKLWNIGWRAAGHAICVFLLALSEYLGFPTLLLLAKRSLVLVNLHVFLVWVGWEDACCARDVCFLWFDARIADTQYAAIQNESLGTMPLRASDDASSTPVDAARV